MYAAVVYFVIGLHRNKWRFTSVPDLYNLFRASTVLALSLLALDYVLLAPNVYGTFYFGKISILLYWFLQMFFLGGLRVAYRYFHYARTLQRVKVADATPTLVLGRAADAEVLLRSIESGAVKKIWPVGVLSPSLADRGQSIRGLRVLGDIEDLEQVVADLERRGERVTRLVLTPSALTPEARPEAILIRARKLGLSMVNRGGRVCLAAFAHEEVPVDVAHIVRNNIYVYGIRGEGKSATHRAEAYMRQKRFDATKIHTHTFPLEELPTAIRYAKDRVEDAIKVVVKAKMGAAQKEAAE